MLMKARESHRIHVEGALSGSARERAAKQTTAVLPNHVRAGTHKKFPARLQKSIDKAAQPAFLHEAIISIRTNGLEAPAGVHGRDRFARCETGSRIPIPY